MNRATFLSYSYGLLTVLMIITAACSSSRKANKYDDESDSGSQSDSDGGRSRE